MTGDDRYRIEDGRTCIDLNVRRSSQIFDGRDPAPFRERDLDEDAVDYVIAAAQEIPRARPLKIVVTIAEEPEPRMPADAIAEAVRTHFIHAREQVSRRLGDHVRRGRIVLSIGLVILIVFLSLAELTTSMPAGPWRDIVREGLVIMGWVAMWRPLEALLYDWWPLIDERRQISRLVEAPVAVRYPSEH